MKKILLVQSRTQEDLLERERKNFRRATPTSVELSYLSALDERLAWTTPDEFLKEYDGVIFGGSSDFDFHGGRSEKDPARIMSLIILSRAKNIVSYALAERIPVLGVCFGHQLIAQMHGGEVSHDAAQGKSGPYEVRTTGAAKHDAVFGDLPTSFIAQYAHKDSVTNLPKGATLLAVGDTCRFSALRYGDRAYTLQFHPEVEHIGPVAMRIKSPEASSIISKWIRRIVGTSAPLGIVSVAT